jgi:lipopolysaccharide export system protein LptA
MKTFLFLFTFAFYLLPFSLSSATVDKPKTYIQGRRMEILKKGEATEFTGGVTLTRENDFMSADRMVNYDKEGTTHAWGNVYLKRRDPVKGVLWEAWGDEGIYDSNVSSGTLWGKVIGEVRQSTPTAKLTRVWADRASYDPTNGSLSFVGPPATSGSRSRFMPPWPAGVDPRPRVVETDDEGVRDLWGDHVTYFEADRRVIAEGSVRANWKGAKNGAAR